jgi:hypothetical protein
MTASLLSRRAAGWADAAVRSIDAADTDIVVVRRPLPLECGRLIAAGTLGEVRFTTTVRGAAAKIDRGLARLDLVKPERQRAALADDILSLVCGMLAVFSWPRVEVRLELTDEQSCPKFHCDNVITRLVTTYVGPGTEFRELDTGETVNRAAPGSLVFLKGHRHPTHADRVLHRSPPVRAGTRRFSVAIDQGNWLAAAAPRDRLADTVA